MFNSWCLQLSYLQLWNLTMLLKCYGAISDINNCLIMWYIDRLMMQNDDKFCLHVLVEEGIISKMIRKISSAKTAVVLFDNRDKSGCKNLNKIKRLIDFSNVSVNYHWIDWKSANSMLLTIPINEKWKWRKRNKRRCPNGRTRR